MDTRSVLVLGGSEFVGRAVVADALAREWRVTTFNRGTNPPLAGVTALQGDRTDPHGLAALREGEWEIVVDTWSWAPSAVRDAARLLAARADHYVYVSSASVYGLPTPAGNDEDTPTVDGSPDDGDDVDYARAKRGGELAATGAFGDRALLLRAGLILGPHENVGRLPWWLDRIHRGGHVLAPGPSELPLQYVDARDLAAWALAAAARGLGGPYNLVSEPGHATMGSLLGACVDATRSDAVLVWTDAAAILAAGVEPWTDLPIWVPPGELHATLHDTDVSKAIAAGLRCRPVAQTVQDTWRWLQSVGGRAPRRADRAGVGLDPQVEARLLAHP